LLDATERDLRRIKAAVERKRGPLRGASEIALKVGAVIGQHKMAKHFSLDIADDSFSFARKQDQIAAEAATDGLYVVRTSLPAETLDDSATVRSYKSLAQVELAFRCLKTVDLQVRPIHHWLADRVRAHVFLCMLAYYIEWHMRQGLAPMLYDDTDKDIAETLRPSVVAKAQRSPSAVATNHRPDRGWAARPQLPQSHRGPGHARPQHRGHRDRAEPPFHHRHKAHPDPAEGARPPRRHRVASSDPLHAYGGHLSAE
jgi:hypothetical protein